MQLKLVLALAAMAAMATAAVDFRLGGGGSTFLYDAPEFLIRACPNEVSTCVFDGVPASGATSCGRCVSRCLMNDLDTFDLFGCHRDLEKRQGAACRTADKCHMKCRQVRDENGIRKGV